MDFDLSIIFGAWILTIKKGKITMKIDILMTRLNGIKNLLDDIKNKRLKDIEFEVEHVSSKLEIIIEDVDNFGVEEVI